MFVQVLLNSLTDKKFACPLLSSHQSIGDGPFSVSNVGSVNIPILSPSSVLPQAIKIKIESRAEKNLLLADFAILRKSQLKCCEGCNVIALVFVQEITARP